MMLQSRRPGNYSKEYTQFDTVQKIKAVFSNQVRADLYSNERTLAMGDSRGKYQKLSHDSRGLFLFYRFNIGLKIRMGQLWRQNRALSTTLLLRMSSKVQGRIEDEEGPRKVHKWIFYASYLVLCYVYLCEG